MDLDDTASMKKRLSAVKTEKNVTFTDMFTVSETMLEFDDKMEQFYEPQVQKEDVISLVVEGTCYYDVEPEDDSWIRVQVEKGDLIVIPKGLSHRFTTTPQVNFVNFVTTDFHNHKELLRKNNFELYRSLPWVSILSI